MRSFILRRLWLAVLVCLTVLVVSFILTRLSGDLAASIAGPNASAADRLLQEIGIDARF
jgi:peptide/nickel transport system permease protein